MSILKLVQTIAEASGATEAAKNLLENAVSADAHDQILTLSARSAYLQEKVLQAESVIKDLQIHVSMLAKENEVLKSNKPTDDALQKELNDLKVDYEDLKTRLSTERNESYNQGLEKGREAANEDRDTEEASK